MPQAVVVVPCYNEAQRLDLVAFRAFAREYRQVRFLFVNDGSTDGTGALLADLVRSDRAGFALCDLPRNVGKAEAVRRGLLRAADDDPEYVGYWDADLATPLEAILTFGAVLDSRPDIELVFGARVGLLGRSVDRHPLRHYLGRVFATAASVALGIGFYDTQCGAKLFRASHEILSLFQCPFATRWLFDVEIVARLIATRRGTAMPRVETIVYEFPLHEWRDVAGSKVTPRDFARAALELAAIARKYRTMPRPWRPRARSTWPRPRAGRPHAAAPLARTAPGTNP
jgi:glycosyltransferase involved in cell wall biosynthesis